MKKLNVRPLYAIEGTEFIVDIDKQVLREFLKPENEISFIRDMTDLQTHYELRYDPATHGAAHSEQEQLNILKIPQMTELDPLNMALKYGLEADQLRGKTDFDVIVDQEALQLRRQGHLPKIDILGEHFYVDLRMRELRHAENFHPILSLRGFELTNDGWHYEAFYAPLLKQVVQIDPQLTEFPDGVVAIKIPNELRLDPIGAARQYGINERELLRRYPIEKELKAELIPLGDTHLPALIRQNREALKAEHAENMRKAKPRHRHHF